MTMMSRLHGYASIAALTLALASRAGAHYMPPQSCCGESAECCVSKVLEGIPQGAEIIYDPSCPSGGIGCNPDNVACCRFCYADCSTLGADCHECPKTPSPSTPPPTVAKTPAPVVTTPTPTVVKTPAPVVHETPAPVTPAPTVEKTPSPVVTTPQPVVPATPAPVTPAPVTSAPVTPATPAPVVTTPQPVVPATPAPVTPSTSAPVVTTPQPVTPATPQPVVTATPAPSSLRGTPSPTSSGTCCTTNADCEDLLTPANVAYNAIYDKGIECNPQCSVQAVLWCNMFDTCQDCRGCFNDCAGAAKFLAAFPGQSPSSIYFCSGNAGGLTSYPDDC